MAYIGNIPIIQSTEFREEFEITASQTVFHTSGYHPAALEVLRNGVLLSELDYTKGADNVTVTLNNAAVNGDIVIIQGRRGLTQGVTISESRVEHTWASGNTYTQLNTDVVPKYSDVYINGVKLDSRTDYTINTSSKQVTFTTTPTIGDTITVVHKNETSSLVAMPLKDSTGTNVLSESNAGTVTTLRLNGFAEHYNIMDQTYTIPTNYNAMKVGPLDVSGTINIQANAALVVFGTMDVTGNVNNLGTLDIR